MGLYENVIFPHFFDFVLTHQGFENARRGQLARAHGRILEIGIGTGLNLDYYPTGVELITAIEPNPGMIRELRHKLFSHRIHVDLHRGGAEALPFRPESFDTVVSTFTFCSIAGLRTALAEIRRVLAPGGRLLFLEHGLSRDRGLARWQHRLNPLQRWIGCGCQLTLDVERSLREAGFSIEDLHHYDVAQAPRVLGQIYDGVARVD